MKLLLLLPSLDAGGAQRQFVQLAHAMARRGHEVVCVALVPGGPYWDDLVENPSLRVLALEARRRPGRLGLSHRLPATALRLAAFVRRERPDLLYSALHIANLFAWLATLGGRTVPVVWGMRAASQELRWRRRLPYELCRLASGRIDLLIANSATGLAAHTVRGYRARQDAVIPNGIDTDLFRPDLGARSALRREWGVAEDEPLVGIVGRLVPVKDHPTFLAAAAALAPGCPNARFVCIGDGPSAHRERLVRQAQELGIAERLRWAGEQRDMPRVYNALDLLCLSSSSEGFPNVLAEAMSCGVPCVATAVGDVATILGDIGGIVPPGDPAALAEAMHRVLVLSPDQRHALGAAARARIVERFGLDAMVAGTEAALLAVLTARGAPTRAATLPKTTPFSEGRPG